MRIFRKILKSVVFTVLGIVALIILILILFYIPPVQDAIFKKVTTELNKGDLLHIKYDVLRIGFPTHLKGKGVEVDLPGEMEASLAFIDADLDLIPLLSLHISSETIDIEGASFRLGSPDSSIYLKAVVDTFQVNDLSVKIKDTEIGFSSAELSGATVKLDIQNNEDEEKLKETKEEKKQFVIKSGKLALNRIDYCMSIEDAIDTLSAKVEHVELNEGLIDLNQRLVKAADFDVTQVVAKFIYTDSSTDNEKIIKEKDSSEPDSLAWTIMVDQISLTASEALYAKAGLVKPTTFNPEYIEVDDIKLLVDSFYNCKQDIRVPIKELKVRDFYGLSVNANGTFSIDSSLMRVGNFNLSLPGSMIKADAMLGLESVRFREKSDIPLKINLEADITPSDLGVFVPSLNTIIRGLPVGTPLLATIDAEGTMDNIAINEFEIDLPRYLNIVASGYISGFSDSGMKNLSSNLRFNGKLRNGNIIKPSVVEARLGKGIHLVPLSVGGTATFYNGAGAARLKVETEKGELALNGKANFGRENYDLSLQAENFPLQSIMSEIGVSDISARLQAKGSYFNPLTRKASLNTSLSLDSLFYHQVKIYAIQANAEIENGNASLRIVSDMPEAELNLRVNGNIDSKTLAWIINGDIANLQLKDLGLSRTENGGEVRMDGHFEINTDSLFINSDLNFSALKWKINDVNINTKHLNIGFEADQSGTVFDITDRDLLFEAYSPERLDSIIKKVPELNALIDQYKKEFYLDIDKLQKSLPKFNVLFTARKNNIISEWISYRGEYFDSLGVTIRNNSSLSLNAILKNYDTPKYIVDSITADIYQANDSLFYKFHLLNSPLSPGDWANVTLFGQLGGRELDLRFNQKNHDGNTGFLLGFDGEIEDSTLTIMFKPDRPIIAYKPWNLNPNNFVSIDFAQKHFDADLTLSQDNSSLRLFTDHLPGSDEQEEINLKLTDIEIGDWVSLNPFATPMKGDLDGFISLSHEGNIYTGDGNISLNNFYYGKQRVGDFELGVDVSTTPHGFIHAGASLDIDSVKVINLYGVLNDTTSVEPFMLKLDIDSLPLKVANPFLNDAGIALSGKLDGEMKVTGSPSIPVFNGFIDFDNTGINVKMLGTTYMLSEKKIPVDTGIVIFDKYDIKAVNDNPLIINGTVNMHDILNPVIDLSFNAKNTQIVGTDRARGGADVYGKAFIDLDATVKGDLSFLKVDADADVLNTTNVTYVMVGGGQNALSSRSNSKLVKFINFADSSMVSRADSIKLTGTLMSIDALLNVSRGSVISVDLSTDGKNKVQLEPVGNLDYTRDVLGAQHLTGRITIDGGFARYTPPLMSEKLFNFQEGSYVDFNGNISNPLLNIHAVDRLRANVNQEGQNSRLIYFNVGLDVTGTLENMNVAFNLSTDDDLTVENELESMSASQRASKAMNLLLTNIYTGPGTTADANLGANALYSFLGSTLNSWAANNIKAVDLSFGVNQYDNTTNGVTSQATSYSYNVSKSLFDDRFKINIGGNYTTDADADENIAENLISDISFEYMLNPNGSMYIKVFRHAGFESILEGEIVQTGVGFTYRKRMNSLRQMFNFILPRKYRYNSVIDREIERYKKKLEKEQKE